MVHSKQENQQKVGKTLKKMTKIGDTYSRKVTLYAKKVIHSGKNHTV